MSPREVTTPQALVAAQHAQAEAERADAEAEDVERPRVLRIGKALGRCKEWRAGRAVGIVICAFLNITECRRK